MLHFFVALDYLQFTIVGTLGTIELIGNFQFQCIDAIFLKHSQRRIDCKRIRNLITGKDPCKAYMKINVFSILNFNILRSFKMQFKLRKLMGPRFEQLHTTAYVSQSVSSILKNIYLKFQFILVQPIRNPSSLYIQIICSL